MNLLYETCAVCDRRFNKIADKNYFELYRDAKIALKHGCRMSSGFVCRKCAHKAATVKCSICGEVERNFVTTHSDGRDSFAKRRLDQERSFLQNVRNRLVDVGSPAIISEDATFVCDNCIGADNNLKAGPANYAIAKWIYGKSGEAIECHCYGANGEPTLHKDGYSSWKTVFDAAGRDVGCKYYDAKGNEIDRGERADAQNDRCSVK